MSLPIDAAPPGPLPRASASPYPLQPPPHGASSADALPVRPAARPAGLGTLAKAVIGGIAAAAIGAGLAVPFLLRGRTAKGKRTGSHG